MAVSGAAATLYASNGTTVFTAAATTKLVNNTVYRLTNALHQRLNPDVAVTVKVNGVAAPVTNHSINYAAGIITFATDQSTAVITVDGSYMLVYAIADVTSVEWTEEIQMSEYVAFNNATYTSRLPVSYSCAGSLTGLRTLLADFNTTAATASLDSVSLSGTPLLLEVALAGGGTWRGWVLLNALTNKISADGMYEGTVGFSAAPFKGVGRDDFAVYGWI